MYDARGEIQWNAREHREELGIQIADYDSIFSTKQYMQQLFVCIYLYLFVC